MTYNFSKKHLIIAAILFLAINSPCEANQNNNPYSVDIMNEIADEYYKQIKQLKESRERHHSAMRDEKFPVPTEATGKILNRKGEPIQNAEITITTESSDILLGKGRTDESGNFHISLNHSNYRRLTIEVLKNQYGRFALTGILRGIVDYEVRLDRDIDESFLQKLLNEKKLNHQIWLLLEIIGTNNSTTDRNENFLIFPYLGLLRPLMLKVLKSNLFEKKDDRFLSPADRIISYLHLWHDPSDQTIIEQIKSVNTIQFIENISAETIAEVCSLWADIHFEQEKVKQRPSYDYSVNAIDSAKKHALATFRVWYAHWGYSYRLILFKEGSIWKLKSVMKSDRWHRK